MISVSCLKRGAWPRREWQAHETRSPDEIRAKLRAASVPVNGLLITPSMLTGWAASPST